MLTAVLLTSTLIALAGARIYDRCELGRDLLRLGVSRDQVSTWVCIAFHESHFNTAAWNTRSGDHGLLQISELYWCGPGKACGVTCSSLRDADISDDVQCALRIYREHTRLQGDGFMAWVVYPQYCRGNMNYLKDCNRLSKSYSEKRYNISQGLLELDVPNFTETQFLDNRPQPRYLAVNALIQRINFKKFERDYYNTNKRHFDWLNFKIDNIDELKLPLTNNRHYGDLATPPPATTYTTTTTVSNTITLEPALIGIKPPSPRKIESNQFRRRKMKLEQEAYKTKNNSLVKKSTVLQLSTPPSLSTTVTTISNYDLSLTKTSPGVPTLVGNTKTTTPSAINTVAPQKTVKEMSSQTFVDDFFTLTTTAKPTTGTTLRATDKGTQKSTTAKPATTRAITPRKGNETFRNFLRYSSSSTSTTTQKQIGTNITFHVIERNESSSNITLQSSNIKQRTPLSNINANITNKIYFNEITSTTQSIINDSEKSKQYESTVNTTKSSTVSEIAEDLTNKALTSTTVSRPATGEPSSREKSLNIQTTTQRPIFSSPSSSTEELQTTKRDSKKSMTTTTQSIFDVYLNPTRSPKLQPFSFAPFNKNPYRVRIFAGGTTASPSGEVGENNTVLFIKKKK